VWQRRFIQEADAYGRATDIANMKRLKLRKLNSITALNALAVVPQNAGQEGSQ
jgi:hypothetical protein